MPGRLIMMMGCPGSGKSTFVENHIINDKEVWVSRDKIRFEKLPVGGEYFSKEKEVFRTFAGIIAIWLTSGYTVWADATHISKASRNKLLRALKVVPADVWIVWIKTPLAKAIEQNEKRAGTRSYVPRSVITRMYNQIDKPEFEEGFNKIIIVEPNEPIKIYEEKK